MKSAKQILRFYLVGRICNAIPTKNTFQKTILIWILPVNSLRLVEFVYKQDVDCHGSCKAKDLFVFQNTAYFAVNDAQNRKQFLMKIC